MVQHDEALGAARAARRRAERQRPDGGSRPRRTLRGRGRATGALLGVVGTLLSVPVALGATTPAVPQTGQRIDMRVLLVSADGTEAGFGGWKAELEREGVPYSEYIADQHAAPLTDDDLADYGTNHAKYSAVILATGDLGTPGQRRRPRATSSASPTPSGRRWPSSSGRSGSASSATTPSLARARPQRAVGRRDPGRQRRHADRGRQGRLPLPQGPVPIANDDPTVAETFGYAATPVNATGLADRSLAGPDRQRATSASTRIPTTAARRWS